MSADKSTRYAVSLSWGKDSLCLLYRLIAEGWPLDEVVYFNNGMEFQSIYDTRDRVLPYLKELGITYTELTPQNPFLYDMLERPVKNRDKPSYHSGYSWCGGPCRWGTSEKLKTILAHCGGATIYVGLAADEPQRFEKCGYPNRSLPLATWGMNEADCLTYCYRMGFRWMEQSTLGPVPLYELLDRVSCWCCANKNLKELKNIYQYLPQYWQRLRGLQAHLDRPMKGYTKSGQAKGVFELEARFRRELEQAEQYARQVRQAAAKAKRQRGLER